MEGPDAVWAETTDGGLLRQLFGYYPTLHDAQILSFDIRRKDSSAEMVVDYTDLAEEGEKGDVSVRMRLLWAGVKSFDLPLEEQSLFGVSFDRDEENNLVTRIETWPNVFGFIVSESFEAILVQADPLEGDQPFRIRYT